MCETCGCGVTGTNKSEGSDFKTIEVMRGLMDANDQLARHNREHFDKHQVTAINLMSSPGSGKTRLLEETIEAISDLCRMLVIEGDLETENDAARIRARGIPAIQITTGNACHLDAAMVHDALHEVELDDVDVVFIENVGNLVCPASFDLGQHLNVVLLSVTEGDDKPAKYPVMFRAANLVVLTKCDLLEFMDDFDPAVARESIENLGTEVEVIKTAAGGNPSIEEWLDWLGNWLPYPIEHPRPRRQA
jgi:hydrogenase nickel incorporation protein HypB